MITRQLFILYAWLLAALLLAVAIPIDAFVVSPSASTASSASSYYYYYTIAGATPHQQLQQHLPKPLHAMPPIELLAGGVDYTTTTTTTSSSLTAGAGAAAHYYYPAPQLLLSASTLDPTTVLQDLFSGVLGTPIILAVPIVAALAVASLIAYLIVAYASPAESED